VESGYPTGVHKAGAPLVFGGSRLDTCALPPMQDNVVALSNLSYARSCIEDDSSSFVPQQERQKFVFAFNSRNLPELSSTDSTAMDLDQHLTAVQSRNFDLIQNQRCIQSFQDGRPKSHSRFFSGTFSRSRTSIESNESVVACVAALLKEPFPFFWHIERSTGELPVKQVGLSAFIAVGF